MLPTAAFATMTYDITMPSYCFLGRGAPIRPVANFSGVQRPRPVNAGPHQPASFRPAQGRPPVTQPAAANPPANPASITAGMQNMNLQQQHQQQQQQPQANVATAEVSFWMPVIITLLPHC